jgi:hypothetical protein
VERDRKRKRPYQEAQRVADAVAFFIDTRFVLVDVGRRRSTLPARHDEVQHKGEYGDRNRGEND